MNFSSHSIKIRALALSLFFLAAVGGCGRLATFQIDLRDDGDKASLLAAGQQQLAYLEGLPPEKIFIFGQRRFSAAALLASSRLFLTTVRNHFGDADFNRLLAERFVLWSPGRGALLTGYYQPRIAASLTKLSEYPWPIYAPPGDDRRFLSRADIESGNRLAGLEAAWLARRSDAFFLHIQGSGILLLPDGARKSARFAATNGLPYTSIGKIMIERGIIKSGEATMPAIRAWLETHPEKSQEILWRNQRFTFFTIDEAGPPHGNLGLPLTPWRSLAVDQNRWPPLAPIFLRSRLPRFDADGNVSGWSPLRRFVWPQDSGAAIQGPGRLDLFCGDSDFGERAAGILREKADYVLLLPKGNQSP
ncbi:MAG: MltA domain-containing protein [Desulfobulbaceae bacterium]|nr:MltA domain-containing protein [Desulfobulbaceae bacterium]